MNELGSDDVVQSTALLRLRKHDLNSRLRELRIIDAPFHDCRCAEQSHTLQSHPPDLCRYRLDNVQPGDCRYHQVERAIMKRLPASLRERVELWF